MTTPRLIDDVARTRQKPIRVLVLGMCRTGTNSISLALRKLAYTPHSMREVLVNPKELALWQEAVNVTLLQPYERPVADQNKAPYGREEFDKLLANYDVVLDLPGCVFAQQLIEAYPEAKVILTKRDYDAWEKSMQESIWCLCTWRLFAFARYLSLADMAPLSRFVHSVFRAHNRSNYGGPAARTAYENHYAGIRAKVPANRLLEVDSESLTWEPLCEFLDRDVPDEPFPRLQEEKAMRANLEKAWWGMVQYLFWMTIPLLMAGLAARVLYYQLA